MPQHSPQLKGWKSFMNVHRRQRAVLAAAALSLALSAMWPRAAPAQALTVPAADAGAAFPSQDALINEAREALKRRDKSRLEALRDTAQRQGHPLASWVDY